MGRVTEPRHQPLPFDPIAEAQRQWVERGWGHAAAGMAAVTSVMRAHQIMLARVDEVLRPFGLTFARYEMLMLLLFSRTGSLPLSKVGSRLQVHPASVTNVVDRLEAQGLVRRAPHPSDGRGVLAEITAAGRELAERASDALNEQVFTEPGLDQARVGDLVDVLHELRRDAGDF
jgi:DNA-binding MarR family transcriptional regulator